MYFLIIVILISSLSLTKGRNGVRRSTDAKKAPSNGCNPSGTIKGTKNNGSMVQQSVYLQTC